MKSLILFSLILGYASHSAATVDKTAHCKFTSAITGNVLIITGFPFYTLNSESNPRILRTFNLSTNAFGETIQERVSGVDVQATLVFKSLMGENLRIKSFKDESARGIVSVDIEFEGDITGRYSGVDRVRSLLVFDKVELAKELLKPFTAGQASALDVDHGKAECKIQIRERFETCRQTGGGC